MLRGRTYESNKPVGMYESKKVKRYRSAFTTGQINYLEKQFEKCPYIGSATRKEVAGLLNIPERAIKIWFQNRRMKEKKEVNSKEYNIDSHNNLSNNMEFAKYSLINVHSSQSTNDRQCSLQPTKAKHVDTTLTSHRDNASYSKQSRIDDLKKQTVENHNLYKLKCDETTNNIKQEIETSFLPEPPSNMKYNFGNRYNNKSFINYLELNKKSVSKSKVLPKTLNTGSFRESMLNVPSTLPQYQDSPEDLSARNLSNLITPQSHQGNIQLNPAYIPFCNTQDVCLTAGNVIWKPINVMPAMAPNTIPVNVPEKQLINQNNAQKCKCNCNCHVNNSNYDQANVEPRPQYVIAIPYNNNLSILR